MSELKRLQLPRAPRKTVRSFPGEPGGVSRPRPERIKERGESFPGEPGVSRLRRDGDGEGHLPGEPGSSPSTAEISPRTYGCKVTCRVHGRVNRGCPLCASPGKCDLRTPVRPAKWLYFSFLIRRKMRAEPRFTRQVTLPFSVGDF